MRNNDPRQPSLSLGDPYNNQGLFADRYLTGEERLLALPEWREAEGVQEAFEAIRDIYDQHAARFTDATNEAQTEEDFIQPVLREALSWEYEVQEPIAGVNRVPDYALLTSPDDKGQIQPLKGTPELWEHVTAVGDAKRWEQDLDRRRGDETPSIQITNYLYRSKVRWGILTNGRHWRLYEQDKARGGDTYYECDLVDLLNAGDLEAFKWFYLFFRRDAFVPVRDEKSFVELVFEGSERYRTEVGDDLKEAVYDALRTLMNGFLAFERNGLDAEDEDQLKQVHDLSLTVLYRLLFLLYAEDKDLLPTADPHYRDYSLLATQQDINRRLRAGGTYAATGPGLWHHLMDICGLIDKGLRDGDRQVIPAYNGGLFSCERYPEIAYDPQEGVPRWEIGDAYLAEAIDQVAYRRERWDEPTDNDVDYATLDVQHLGSIYEGLLELRPAVAEEPMIEQPGASGKPPLVKKKSEVSKPKKVRGQTPREFAPGEVYLVTDRGERKATGSYYTPKYIVDYIVEHTVGELAEEAAAEVHQRWQQIASEHACESPEDLDALIASAENGTKRQRLEHKRLSLLEPYLSLKILDPAMGSGHFLVGAADYLSLAMATDPYLPPIPAAEQGNPQAYYKRQIVQHCLYGVDLNPLAVELAKLSLWLHTVSRDKALSFLDHHLRCGNSLIGARLQEDLSNPPPAVGGGEQAGEGPQLAMRFDATLERNDLVAFLDAFRRIVEAPVGDAGIERQKDAWYREMDERRNAYRQVANVWLAPYFGVQVTPAQYGSALEALRAGRGSDQWRELTGQEWFRQAQDVGGRDGRRFFHWELEFPEAFFQVQQSRADWKPEDERGFDAVIGNPPYVTTGRLRERDMPTWAYLANRWGSASHGKFDLYLIFVELGMRWIREPGRFGMIVPNKWMQSDAGQPLRELTAGTQCLDLVVDFGAHQVFQSEEGEGPTTYTCLCFLAWPASPLAGYLRVRPAQLSQVRGVRTSVRVPDLGSDPWALGANLLRRESSELFVPLTDAATVFVGTTTNADDVFILEEARRVSDDTIEAWSEAEAARIRVEAGICVPFLRGRDIDRYAVHGLDTVVISPYRLRDGSGQLMSPEDLAGRYPRAWAYLARHRGVLEARENGRWVGASDWYCHAYPRNFFMIGTPKIVSPDVAERPEFALDADGCYFALNTVYGVARPLNGLSLQYCQAVLNSAVFAAYIAWSSVPLRGGYIRVAKNFMAGFPLRVIDRRDGCSAADRGRLLQRGKSLVSSGSADTANKLSRESLVAHALAVGKDLPPWTHEHFSEEEIEELRDFPGREDFVHDLLAELAQRMIDLNKDKHDLIERFEADLRGLADPDTAEKLQKGKQARTLFKHESCQPFVEEGSHSTRHLHESLAWSEEAFEVFVRELAGKVPNLADLLATYRTYADDYRDQTEALTRTDELIDQIVYALYGLTEEEIAIVEESVGRA